MFLSHPDIEVDEGKRSPIGKGGFFLLDKETVQRFVERAKAKNGNPDKVKVVAVDKFHVIKNCSDAVDNVRRREMSGENKTKSSALDRTRYIWFKNPDNLTDKQRGKLNELTEIEYLD